MYNFNYCYSFLYIVITGENSGCKREGHLLLLNNHKFEVQTIKICTTHAALS